MSEDHNVSQGAAYKEPMNNVHIELNVQAPEAKNTLSSTKKEEIPNIQKQKQEVNCFLALLCYIGEFLFYPPIMLIYYLIVLILSNACFIIIGCLLCILLPFTPFFLLCCLCENGKQVAIVLLILSMSSLGLILFGCVYLVFSPVIAVAFFFWTYVLIFTGKVSPYYSFGDNWSTMTLYLSNNKEWGVRFYSELTKKHKKNESN